VSYYLSAMSSTGSTMLPSFHDDYLVSYEVNCEARRIRLQIREWEPEGRIRTVSLDGVEGYRFSNDAFGNIIFSLQTIPLDEFLSEFAVEVAESYHFAGAPGPWAADLGSAGGVLAAKGVQAFVLTSSYGMSGWVLAKEASVIPN
jgi:hypothetical protein